MSKKNFLAVTFSLLSLLQLSHPSQAAGADQHPSHAQKNQASPPKKEETNTLSVYMHGAYAINVYFDNCEKGDPYETVYAGRSINRCAKEGTEVYVKVHGAEWMGNIPLHNKKSVFIDTTIRVPKEGIKMDCGQGPRCDWSTPYEMQ